MFLLIIRRIYNNIRNGVISIHLMFLLIQIEFNSLESKQNFNTSHVSINLCYFFVFLLCFTISIHLMFLLISFMFHVKHSLRRISIHLMFLLISVENVCQRLIILISIHLMFLLIREDMGMDKLLKRFQYISCFY